MKQLPPLPLIPPQQDVISLDEAMDRTRNWRNAINSLFPTDETKVPHAIFIPLEDIMELRNLATDINNYPESTINVVGVRAYFSLNEPIVPSAPFSEGNQLDALLVLVYQAKNPTGENNEFHFNSDLETKDLVAPVASAGNKKPKGKKRHDGAETYTIYDITRPCPNLCDTESELFGPLLSHGSKPKENKH